jgi:F-type H+-transporting ATPase subunit delta
MRNITVAKRYARAIYQVALESKSVDDVRQALSNVAGVVKSSPEVRRAVYNPLVSPAEKSRLLKPVTSNKLVLKLVSLLSRRKRLSLLLDVFDQFAHMADDANGLHRVTVKTPLPLSDEQKRSIEEKLASSLGGRVTGTFEVAKELIGGMWVRIGDQVLDASLKGLLDDLRHTLIHSAN